MRHVKGHSGDRWNDRADALANQGAAGGTCDAGRWRKARQPPAAAAAASADGYPTPSPIDRLRPHRLSGSSALSLVVMENVFGRHGIFFFGRHEKSF